MCHCSDYHHPHLPQSAAYQHGGIIDTVIVLHTPLHVHTTQILDAQCDVPHTSVGT